VTGDPEDRVDVGDAAGETNGDFGVVEGVTIEAAEVGVLEGPVVVSVLGGDGGSTTEGGAPAELSEGANSMFWATEPNENEFTPIFTPEGVENPSPNGSRQS
jgi:hypothetical protein